MICGGKQVQLPPPPLSIVELIECRIAFGKAVQTVGGEELVLVQVTQQPFLALFVEHAASDRLEHLHGVPQIAFFLTILETEPAGFLVPQLLFQQRFEQLGALAQEGFGFARKVAECCRAR